MTKNIMRVDKNSVGVCICPGEDGGKNPCINRNNCLCYNFMKYYHVGEHEGHILMYPNVESRFPDCPTYVNIYFRHKYLKKRKNR